jgi:uncharacterized protein YkwD
MIKKTIKTFGIIILISILNLPSAFASFSDVLLAHPNREAILYLQTNNVIEGYDDETFKPNQEVNRVEFLKIILEGSNVPLTSTSNTPFPDVNHNAWYGPYLKKAYQEGWIEGYPDGTFKPSQNINKVEALKILGKVQNWDLPTKITTSPYSDTPATSWYTPYVVFAKERDFLEEQGPNFNPGKKMTRAGISEVIYRTMTSDLYPQTYNQLEIIPEEEPQTAGFSIIEKDFFRDITLKESLPNTFYQNEIYLIEGQLPFTNATTVTIILETDTTRKTFSGKTTNNQFSIPVYFSTTGEHLLGIIPGESGSGSATKIKVLPTLPNSTNNQNPPSQTTNQQIYFSDGQTFVEFSAQNETIKKIDFTQSNKTVTYFTRQNHSKIPINYSDFEQFQEGTVSYSISSAKISSSKPLEISSGFNSGENRTFQAIQHQFSETKNNEITATPPETLSSVSPISFSGTAKTNIRYNAYVIKPNGFVENIPLSTTGQTYTYFGSTIIKAGSNFTYTYSPSTAGTYIVEINNLNGEPALNHTVYVNTGIPLLPDFFDLHERKLFTGTLNLTSARQEMLNLINKSRLEHGLQSVTLSSEINPIAQNHSQDMADNNYFSHINLQGQTPEDRRIAAGLKSPIGENLAKDTSIQAAHYGLMRSASHRQNLLTPEWTRVGIGIVNKNGQLFITQNFSVSELNTNDLTNMETELLTQINNLRSSQQIATLPHSETLKSVGDYINKKIIEENAQLTNALFQEAINEKGVSGISELIGRISTNWSAIVNSIINEETSVNNNQWKKIGIDIQLDNIGNIHTILILNR